MKLFNLTPEEKKIHNEKVDRRRKTIKRILMKTGSGLKKTWKYLGETRLAKQNKNKDDKPKPKQPQPQQQKKQPRKQTNVTNIYINTGNKQQEKKKQSKKQTQVTNIYINTGNKQQEKKKQSKKQTQSNKSGFKDIDWFNPQGR